MSRAPDERRAAGRGPRVECLPPVVDGRTRLLVLGSMPGAASLAAGQYYAHPRNLFWALVDELLGVPRALPYEQRVAGLLARGVGLWDVLAACERPGSLDAAIVARSAVANDLPGLLARHPSIRAIACNGGTAAATFRRHVLPALADARMSVYALPSTSPANAGTPLARKRAAWAAALDGVRSNRRARGENRDRGGATRD